MNLLAYYLLASGFQILDSPVLAQASLESIPDTWLKQMAVFILVAITATSFAAAAIFSGLQYFLDRRNASRHERKNSSTDKRLVSDEMCLQRHIENRTRIEKTEEDLRALRSEMHSEDRAIRQDLAEKFSSIQRLLGRIEEKIDSK
jgi:DNA anti-recombination protein RmuC